MTTQTQQAKCEQCGEIFTLGVDGVTTADGHDICDSCNHTLRNCAHQVIDQSYTSEMIERMIERLR